ncbi:MULTISPECIES: transglycosylase SLT domain-containing protein [Candidatus Ichthyocystis]|uniref:transglycosylase SLT domain-containing protein n=1 Tax=Candidatus Ichthyocystis TaxID=2929841 RepID=UPI000A7FF2CE|nr:MULTISPECIES: transglycosylase SLT domain-containing protein [Ichthyocystis]
MRKIKDPLAHIVGKGRIIPSIVIFASFLCFYLVQTRIIDRHIRYVIIASRLSPGLLSLDHNGNIGGYEYQLIQRLADNLKCPVILKILPQYSNTQEYVERGKADLSVDLSDSTINSHLYSVGPFLIIKKIDLSANLSDNSKPISVKEERSYWEISPGSNPNLLKEIISFHDALYSSGDLGRLQKKFFDNYWSKNLYNLKHFIMDVRKKLPKYKHMFIRATKQTNIDWRLLAALAYQESHWNTSAKSPTGVTGFMQLTEQTARELSIKKGQSVQSEIEGAARYLSSIENSLGCDSRQKLWIAVAAYNIGLSHVSNYIEATKTGYHTYNAGSLWGALPARITQAILTVEKVKTYYTLLKMIEP